MSYENSKSKNFCIGIVGAGYAASVHSKALKKINSSITQYVYDVNHKTSKEFAEKYGCTASKNLNDFYNYINAVIIATPVFTHHALVLDAIKRDKHVLCEKPMSVHISEALEMYQMSQRKNLICAIGFNYRFFEIIEYIKRIEIGKILETHIVIKRLFRSDWKKNEISVLSDLGIHLIDLITYLNDSNISLDACKVQMKYIDECDYDSVVNGKLDNGVLFTLVVTRIDEPSEVRFCIQMFGENGIFQYDSRNENVYSIKDDYGIREFRFQKTIVTDDFFDFSDSVLRQDVEWLNAILGNKNVNVATFEDGYRSQEALNRFLVK